MAQIKYRPTDTIELDFGLNVEGTSHSPDEVRLLIAKGGKTYGTVASEQGGIYKASFDLSSITGLEDNDKLELAIAVELKGRVFKPFKRQIEIIDYTEKAPTVDATNQALDAQIQDTEIKTETVQEDVKLRIAEPGTETNPLSIEDLLKAAKRSKQPEEPKKIPAWAKDVLSDPTKPSTPTAISTPLQDITTDVLTDKPKKPEKIRIKFEKPKPISNNAQKTKIEIHTDEIKFTKPIKKKKLQKRKIEEAFIITEGSIKYL